MTQTVPQTPPRQELVRAIGRWSMAALTVNCIVGSGIFGLPAELARLLGAASVVAVLASGAAIGIVMACFAELASQFTETGGPYLYVQAAFGRLMGIEVAWLVWLVRLTACAANVTLFATYLGEFWPRATQPVPRFLILSVLVWMLAAINIRGVRVSTHVSNAFTVAKLASLGLVCVAGGFYLVASHRIVPPSGVHADAKTWMQGMVLLIFAYGGFEAALISTGEAKDPRRDTPFGLFAALIICTVIYALIQWVVVGTLPDPSRSVRPLADVARIAMGNSGAGLVAAGALFSIYGYLTGNILATPRITFALAERRDFPALFAAVHRRFHTPYFSIFVFALLVWLLALFGSFTWNATLSAGARLICYGLVCAAVPVLRRKRPEAALFRLPAGLWFAGTGVLICFGLLIRLIRVDTGKTVILVAAITIALLNWVMIRGDS